MRRGAIAALAVVALLSCAVGATAAEEGAPRARTDQQLRLDVTRLDAEAERIGSRLLRADARRDEVVEERDAARVVLARFLRDAYLEGSTASSGGVLAAILVSGSLGEAADRVRAAAIVSGHQASVVRALDEAELQLDVSRVQRAALITRLGAVQARLVELRAEQDRRAALRREHARERAARRAASDARQQRAKARTSGVLVADTGGGATPLPATAAPSAAMIDAYLAAKGSPLAGHGVDFVASGQRWQVDPRLLVAIAGAESNFGSVTCGPNNAWGWACPNDPADFATWAAGIDTVTRGLRRYYLDEGRTSVALIQQKYCPVGAANDPTGLNSHWAENVTRFLLELGGNPSVVGPGPIGRIELPDFGGLGITAVD